jgi:hypothetical protein
VDWRPLRFKGLVDDTKKPLGLVPPLRVFRDLGRFTVAGFIEGVDDFARGVSRAFDAALAAPVIEAPGIAAGGREAAVSIGDISIHVTVESGGGADAEAMGRGIRSPCIASSSMRSRRRGWRGACDVPVVCLPNLPWSRNSWSSSSLRSARRTFGDCYWTLSAQGRRSFIISSSIGST